MAKYIFIKPFSKQVTVGGVVGIRNFSYKVGDIVEGTVVTNNQTEPPSFLVVDGTSGLLKIGFGGRGWNTNKIFEPYSGTTTTTSTPPKTGENGNQQKLQTETKSFFTPKNILIGVLAIGAIFGLLKWKKVI